MPNRQSLKVLVILLWLSAFTFATEVIIVPSSEAEPYLKAKDALEKQLSSDGYKTSTIFFKDLEKQYRTLLQKTDCIFVAIGTKAAEWLHKNDNPPILLTYCMVADPAVAGLTSDPPISGYSSSVPIKTQFSLISNALPKVRTIGILHNSKSPKGVALLKEVKSNLPKRWRVEIVTIDKYKSVAQAINDLFKSDIDIVWTSPDSTIYNRATVRTLLLTSIRKKIPVYGFSLPFVKAGSLLGITIDPETQGIQTATMIRKIVQAQNDKIPIEYDNVKYEIALNLIVAERLSIDLPKSQIKKAKYVIQNKKKN